MYDGICWTTLRRHNGFNNLSVFWSYENFTCIAIIINNNHPKRCITRTLSASLHYFLLQFLQFYYKIIRTCMYVELVPRVLYTVKIISVPSQTHVYVWYGRYRICSQQSVRKMDQRNGRKSERARVQRFLARNEKKTSCTFYGSELLSFRSELKRFTFFLSSEFVKS